MGQSFIRKRIQINIFQSVILSNTFIWSLGNIHKKINKGSCKLFGGKV